MLKSMDPKYRPEPFDPPLESTAVAVLGDMADRLRGARHTAAVELTEPVVSHAPQERQRNQAWPVAEFAISRGRLWQEIWIPAAVVGAGLMLVFSEINPQTRGNLLFLVTICLLLLPSALKAVGRALFPNRKGSVRLESDGLVFDPGLGQTMRGVRYEQIWDVDVTKATKVVHIKYHPAGFTGQIDEERVASMSLDFLQDAEGPASELGKRIYGIPPRRSAAVKHTVKGLLRMCAWLLLFVLAWFETVMIFSILTALKYL
jgi:hypothetical protein